MKVTDLIEKLKEQPPNADVLLTTWAFADVEKVTLAPSGVEVILSGKLEWRLTNG